MELNNAVHFASGFFANGYFIASVCGIILLGSLAVWLYSIFGWRVHKGSWGVRRAVREVATILGQPGITAAEILDKVSRLQTNPINRQVVDDLSDLREVDGKLYRLPDAGRSSYADLLHFYFDTRSLDAWPNVFVGVGLLLTFVGLALSLWNASQGAASGDIAVVKQSVTTLLEFSAVKFTTSLVALFCSISLGIALRFQRHSLDDSLLRLERQLNKLVPPLTLEIIEAYKLSAKYRISVDESRATGIVKTLLAATETKLAFQNIELVLEECKEQTAQLTSFNSGLAIQLAGVLDSKLQPMLASLADRIEKSLTEMGGSLGQSNEVALKSLLESFIEELRATTSSDTAELQNKMQLLAEELSRASRELAERMGAVFSGMEQTGDRFAAVLNTASAAFRDEIGRVQSDIGSGLTTALAALAESTNRSSRESEALVEKLSAGATSFKTSVEAGGSSFVSELGRGVQSIDTIVERLGQSVGHLGSIVDRTAAFAEQSSLRTGERIGELQNTIAQVDRSFQKVSDATVPFGQAAEHVRTSIDLLRATQTSVQSKLLSLQAAADSIERASSGLTNTFDRDIGRMSESLSSTTDRLKEAISVAAKESESAGTRLADAVRATLTEYEHRFAGIDKELQAALTTVVDTFAKTYEEIRTRVDTVDGQMAKSVNQLVSFNDRFEENVESISDAIAKLPRALAS